MSRAQTGVLDWRPDKFPLQVRIYQPSGGWFLYSRHVSPRAAQRAYVEAVGVGYTNPYGWTVKLVDTRKQS